MVNSTQSQIDIAGIRDGLLLMKDGSYRLILQVAAANFSLKSEQEQNSIIFQFQGFLNSLHFPIEVVIRSRQLDLSPYLAKVQKRFEAEPNELIKMQIADYTDFLKKLIEMANIMKKTFYVTVSYNPVGVKQMGILDKILKKQSVFDHLKVSETEYKSHTEKLMERGTIVASGLGTMGLHCFQLSTEQLIDLFYQIYNPDEASKERIKDPTMLSSAIIASQDEFTGEQKPGTGAKVAEAAAPETMIDNSSLVKAQKEQEAAQKKQEIENGTAGQVQAQPAAAKPADKPPAAPAAGTAQPQAAQPAPVQAPASPAAPGEAQVNVQGQG